MKIFTNRIPVVLGLYASRIATFFDSKQILPLHVFLACVTRSADPDDDACGIIRVEWERSIGLHLTSIYPDTWSFARFVGGEETQLPYVENRFPDASVVDGMLTFDNQKVECSFEDVIAVALATSADQDIEDLFKSSGISARQIAEAWLQGIKKESALDLGLALLIFLKRFHFTDQEIRLISARLSVLEEGHMHGFLGLLLAVSVCGLPVEEEVIASCTILDGILLGLPCAELGHLKLTSAGLTRKKPSSQGLRSRPLLLQLLGLS